MQRDRGLTRTRSTCYDESAANIRANDRILLGLNRGDDVIHPASAIGRECSHQGCIRTRSCWCGPRSSRVGEEFEIENVFDKIHDIAVSSGDMRPRFNIVVVGMCCLVERGCGRCAPVNLQDAVIIVQ